MAKICKDFTFNNKKFSDFKTNGKPKYIFVNFDDGNTVPLSLNRDMIKGESNRYRTEANYFYDQWNETLPIEFNITKNPDIYNDQCDFEFTKEEIREITRWLTSSHLPKWLNIERDQNEEVVTDATRYKGWFANVETWVVFGTIYGLRLSFQCTTPFAYTDEKVNETTVSTHKNLLVVNNSDNLEGYIYPKFEIKPNDNGQIYICNLSDCILKENGTLVLSTHATYIDALLEKVKTYALANGCEIKYGLDFESNKTMNVICNNTAFQFYLVDVYGNYTKCTAFYMEDTKEYRIIEGGFMYFSVYRNLDLFVDTQKLTIVDNLNRMVTYDKLGIKDIDSIYWLRLINGNNSLLLYGNFNFKIKHSELRKVGE